METIPMIYLGGHKWLTDFGYVESATMPQWQLEPKPRAELTAVDPEPIDRGDGARVQRWQTTQGKIHAQVIYPTGRVEWYLQVSGS